MGKSDVRTKWQRNSSNSVSRLCFDTEDLMHTKTRNSYVYKSVLLLVFYPLRLKSSLKLCCCLYCEIRQKRLFSCCCKGSRQSLFSEYAFHVDSVLQPRWWEKPIAVFCQLRMRSNACLRVIVLSTVILARRTSIRSGVVDWITNGSGHQGSLWLNICHPLLHHLCNSQSLQLQPIQLKLSHCLAIWS